MAWSTYRLQLSPAFGFYEAAELVPYLSKLGITHVYLSPTLTAVQGSTHGYDVVDPTRVSEVLGGREGHAKLTEVLRDAGMGQIVDVVPNHMAISGRDNPWWWDVLRHGVTSSYARYFDIDWDPPEVLLPVLGDHYGRVLERGELRLASSNDGYVVSYFDNEFPIDPETMNADADVDKINADVERLDALISKQHYRLAFWRVASEELDYRRFFDIDSLIAVNADADEVFEATHAVVLDWLNQGSVDGVRIDHVDGLRNPVGYLRRLRERAPHAWIGVEKILKAGERLPASWPVQGTTGYEALGLIQGLFVEPDSEESFTRLFADVCGVDAGWKETVFQSKTHVIKHVLGSDVARLTATLARICESRRLYRDYTRPLQRRAVETMLVAFPVYRNYVVPESSQVTVTDVSYVEEAVRIAREIAPEVDPELLELLADILTLRVTGTEETRFVSRFQQVSGAVAAKGVEDTAFYRYVRFIAANEVGNEADRWCVRPDDFHEAAVEAQKSWPQTMTATTTHDTKRSEDTRMRLALLSEIPGEWSSAVERFMQINERHRRAVSGVDSDGERRPDRSMEYMLYQTLVGAYPLDVERALEFMVKASKESKTHTSWTSPDPAYDDALELFVRSVCADEEFLTVLAEFVEPLIAPGRLNALSATTVKLTMPGVPDTYQGCELWNHSLVDPDNRRPVDYELRRNLLDRLGAMSPEDVMSEADSGLAKLLVTNKCLELRKKRSDCFDERGLYSPVYSKGEKEAHILAFARGSDVVVAVPRLVVGLDGSWGDTFVELPTGSWRNIFTDDVVQGGHRDLGEVLRRFPVGVFERL